MISRIAAASLVLVVAAFVATAAEIDDATLLDQATATAPRVAARELGRRMNAPAFARFLEGGDQDLVEAWIAGARTQGGVLPPAVETLAVRYFDHPRLGWRVQGLLDDTTYTQLATFDALARRLTAQPNSARQTAHRIVRTDLPVTDHIVALLPNAGSGACELLTYVAAHR